MIVKAGGECHVFWAIVKLTDPSSVTESDRKMLGKPYRMIVRVARAISSV